MTDGDVRIRESTGKDSFGKSEAPVGEAKALKYSKISWPKRLKKFAVFVRTWFPWLCTLLTMLRVFLPAPYAKVLEDFVHVLRHFLLII